MTVLTKLHSPLAPGLHNSAYSCESWVRTKRLMDSSESQWVGLWCNLGRLKKREQVWKGKKTYSQGPPYNTHLEPALNWYLAPICKKWCLGRSTQSGTRSPIQFPSSVVLGKKSWESTSILSGSWRDFDDRKSSSTFPRRAVNEKPVKRLIKSWTKEWVLPFKHCIRSRLTERSIECPGCCTSEWLGRKRPWPRFRQVWAREGQLYRAAWFPEHSSAPLTQSEYDIHLKTRGNSF